jgi:hypothetical protein
MYLIMQGSDSADLQELKLKLKLEETNREQLKERYEREIKLMSTAW